MSQKKKQGPKKTKQTKRSARSVASVIESRLIFSTPVLALANDLRRRAATLRSVRPSDDMAEALERIAAEISDAVQEGRKNEWLDTAFVSQLAGLSVDTVRRHAKNGILTPAKQLGGVWLIHRSAVEVTQNQEAA